MKGKKTMPMSTELKRNGERVELAWSWWHLGKLIMAIRKENPEKYNEDGSFKRDEYEFNDFGPYPYGYVFKEDHTASAEETEIWSDGEKGVIHTFEIKAGDVYSCWR